MAMFGKVNNPEGKNQYTSGGGGSGIGSKLKAAGVKLGGKIGGAAESASMQAKGVATAAKNTMAANKGKSLGAQAKGMAKALPAGRRLGAAAAKESFVGEARGEAKAASAMDKVGKAASAVKEKASSAAGAAKEKVKSTVSKMRG